MPKLTPVTVGGTKYPSQAWADAVRQLKAQGKAETTSNIRAIMGGEGLEKTLPPEQRTEEVMDKSLGTPTVSTPELPEEKTDDLAAMRILMRNISQGAYAKGIGTGMKTVTGGLEEQGLGVEGMSGDITSRIINFVEGQVREPIESQFKTMADIMEGIERKQANEKQNALTNLSLLINNDALGFMEDDELANWAAVTGVSPETLAALKQTTTANIAAVDSYVRAVEAGAMNPTDVPEDIQDMVVQKVDWTQIPQTLETYAPPSSYKEWQLAGGQAGTGLTYGEFITGAKSPGAIIPRSNPEDYTGNLEKLFLMSTPKWMGTPLVRLGASYWRSSVLNYAFASSGKQMSYKEAEMQYENLVAKLGDSPKTMIGKMLNLRDSLATLQQTATGTSLEQAELGLLNVQKAMDEFEIKKDTETDESADKGFMVETPEGSWTFPTQEAADAFKKEIGL